MGFIQIAKQAKDASLKIGGLSTETKNSALNKIAELDSISGKLCSYIR